MGSGRCTSGIEKLLNVTEKALMAGIKAAKGGNKVGDISLAIERIAIANKYGREVATPQETRRILEMENK